MVLFRLRHFCSFTSHLVVAGFVFCLTSAAVAAPPTDLDLTLVTNVLGSPLAVRHAGDGSGRIFIVTRHGKIYIHDGNQLLSTPFLDISGQISAGGERGLLGLAFHPDFSNNRYFFVNYSTQGSLRTRISRFEVPVSTPNVADVTSEYVLLEVAQPSSNHNGGDIHFGPDEYLYIGMGDGGGSGDPGDRARDLRDLLGKMLRIDVNGSSPGSGACGLVGNYGIPESNPFVNNSNACDEIWAYGLRNPWRWSFDRTTHDLFIGDVGQGAWEEVDFQPSSNSGGEYYGWSCMEGNHVFDGSRCDNTPMVAPILEYPHSDGCSITGGYRYRGPILGINGTYIYGDYCRGNIWFAEFANGSWTSTLWRDGNWSMDISSFGEDEVGNVYVVDLRGDIYRFDSASSTNDCSLANEVITGAVQNGEVFDCAASQSITVEGFTVEAGGQASLRAPEVRFVTDAMSQISVQQNGILRVMP